MNTIDQRIIENMNRPVTLEGPIPWSEGSHPFCAMKYSRVPTDPADFGYGEEEYFMSGTAAVYGADEGDGVFIKKPALPYKTRLLLRRPLDMKRFSGRVYVDIMNASQGCDIEDLWHRNAFWCMEGGHGYVGITSKPVCVMALKTYDYDRYQSLNWSNGEALPQPTVLRYASIPGTEEGLLWDMLGQLAARIRHGGGDNLFCGGDVGHIYLSGQSQSGAYLNTFVHYFGTRLIDRARGEGGLLFDGFFNIVGAALKRPICQEDPPGPLGFSLGTPRPTPIPFISISSEGDIRLMNSFSEGNILDIHFDNRDTRDNKYRHYDIPGIPHTDVRCPLLSSAAETARAGRPQEERDLKNLNDLPAEYYIVGLLEKLHLWASKGIAPEIVPPFVKADKVDGEEGMVMIPGGGGTLRGSPKAGAQRDGDGNVIGGLRSPYLDVPIATYVGSSPQDPEGISGTLSYFSKEKFLSRYGSVEQYLDRFREYTEGQVKEGWISRGDAERMIHWSREVSQRYR